MADAVHAAAKGGDAAALAAALAADGARLEWRYEPNACSALHWALLRAAQVEARHAAKKLRDAGRALLRRAAASLCTSNSLQVADICRTGAC